jgi:adenylate cyclase
MRSVTAFLSELRRRRVFRVLVGYCAAALAVIGAANDILPALSLPAWTVSLVVVLALVGLPVALVLAWAFDVTPDGVTRTPDEDEAPGAAPAPSGARPTRARYAAVGIVVLAAGAAAYAWFALAARTGDGADVAHSVAVLPFVNLSGDPANEYFSDGLTEEILNALANVPELNVPARTSSFAFKGKAEDVVVIGQRLRVTHLLEGSVQRAGDRVRITAQLIDARSGLHQWSHTYTIETKDLFAAEDEISRDVARELRVRLAPRVVLARGGTDDPRAHDLYLQGLATLYAPAPSREAWKAHMLDAIRDFQGALAVDSTYALAWSGIADAYSLLSDDFWPPREAQPRAKEALLEALALDPGLAEAHASLGAMLLWFDWDRAGAERELRRALTLNPRYALAHMHLSGLYQTRRQFREGAAEMAAAERLDPENPRLRGFLDQARTRAGEGGPLRDSLQAAVRAHPGDHELELRLLGVVIAAERWRDAAALTPGASGDSLLAPLCACAVLIPVSVGDTPTARRRLDRQVAYAHEHYVRPADIAAGYMALGEKETALRWLERGFRERDQTMISLDEDDYWAPLRGDPRFEAIRRRVGLPAQRPPATRREPQQR